jgi:UDP-2,3-diacylglucosamine pyrophosphatase LpxH
MMATEKKTVVISDVHMSNDKPYSWFEEANSKKLAKMLTTLANDETVEELVLLGDLFDLWLYPVNTPPLTVKDIIEANDPVVQALRDCLKDNRTVYFMNGNHDMGVTQKDLDMLAGSADKIQLISPEKYERDHPGWRLEHGNAADMFNAPDDSDDTIGGYPFGYFITRLVATADDEGKVWRVLKELYEHLATTIRAIEPAESAMALGAVRPQRVAIPWVGALMVDLIVNTLSHIAEVNDSTTIRFSEPELDAKEYTVGDIKTKYGSLLGRWYDKYPVEKLVSAMLATHDLGWYAEDLVSANPERNVVVMGHTHASVSGNPYDNDGCWCKAGSLGHGDANPTYVEIEGDEAKVVPWR